MEFKFSNNHGSESEPANTESLVQQLQYQQQQEQIHQHQQLMMNLDPNQVNSSILQNHIAEVDSNISNEENVSLEIPFLWIKGRLGLFSYQTDLLPNSSQSSVVLQSSDEKLR